MARSSKYITSASPRPESSSRNASSSLRASSTKTSASSRTTVSSKPSPIKQKSPSKVTKKTAKAKSRRHSGTKTEKEPELDPEDFDGAIARCKARIKAGIEVELHQDQLKVLKACKVQKGLIMAKWPGLSYSVGNRLEFFKSLKEFLEETGDPHKIISTITAIMEAYKSGKLKWLPGYVTYWSYGKQITQPREFDWDEFLIWNFKYKGSKGFWVEGLRDTASHVRRFWKRSVCWPAHYIGSRADHIGVKVPICLRHVEPPPADSELPDLRTTVDPKRPKTLYPNSHVAVVPRIPIRSLLKDTQQGPADEDTHLGVAVDRTERAPRLYEGYSVLWMNDDTGSDICTITTSDLDTIRIHGSGVVPVLIEIPLLGYVRVQGATGNARYEPVVALEINVRSNRGAEPVLVKGQWDIIEVAIAPNPTEHGEELIRLVGPWLRHRFYTATAPDRTGRLWIIKKHRRLLNVGSFRNPPYFDESGRFPVKTMRNSDGLVLGEEF